MACAKSKFWPFFLDSISFVMVLWFRFLGRCRVFYWAMATTPKTRESKRSSAPENLRPIILLSVLRKILTICLIDRTWDRLKQHIPPDQAAYQPGRGTTERIFAIKILAEKAIISQDYNILFTTTGYVEGLWHRKQKDSFWGAARNTRWRWDVPY